MTIWANFLLFLPVSFGICIVSSALRRNSNREIMKNAFRMFLYMTTVILAICAGVHFIMEWVLGY